MNHCPQRDRVQDWLDGQLEPGDASTFATHLAGCPACEREVAAYRRVWAELAAMPLLDPRPGFADRVLAAVRPVRAPRWVRALGWAYVASLGASLAALALAFVAPAPRAWMAGLLVAAARSLAGVTGFALHALGDGLGRAGGAATSGGTLIVRIAAMLRRHGAGYAPIEVMLVLGAALAACALVLWWMRPRERGGAEGVGHVGLLGL